MKNASLNLSALRSALKLLICSLLLVATAAYADSVSSGGGGGIKAQATTPGTQQTGTNFNIDGTGLLARASISGKDCGDTDYFDACSASDDETAHFQSAQASFILDSSTGSAHIFFGRNSTVEQDIYFQDGLSKTLSGTYLDIQRENTTDDFQIIDNNGSKFLKIQPGALGSGFTMVGGVGVAINPGFCSGAATGTAGQGGCGDVTVQNVRTNGASLMVMNPGTAATQDLIDFWNHGNNAHVAYIDNAANFFPWSTIDIASGNAGTFNIGTGNATAITLGKAGVAVSMPGGMTSTSLDVGVAGLLSLGTTLANAITLGASTFAVSSPGGLTINPGKAFDVNAAGAADFATNTATSLVFAKSDSSATSTFRGALAVSKTAQATPATTYTLSLTPAADTALTASTEASDYVINGSSKTWATGALATQRMIQIGQPTINFAGASNLTFGSTLDIAGAPVAGGNATIGNSAALNIEQAAVTAGTTTSYGAIISAQTGATSNYGLQVLNGSIQVTDTISPRTAPSPSYMLSLNPSTRTSLGASTESYDFFLGGEGSTWNTGALSIQRFSFFGGSSIAFVAASTVTDAATVGIQGAPSASTNATITNSHGLLISARSVGAGTTNSYGLTVNAQTGATNNYAAQFIGGNVGIGTATPAKELEVNSGEQFDDLNAGGIVKANTSGVLSVTSIDTNCSGFSSANLAAGKEITQCYSTHGATVDAQSRVTIHVASADAGNFVIKLCDTAACAGTVFLTCTQACNTAVGTATACTVTTATIPAATALVWSVQTACAVTDPAVNVNAHMTEN